VNTLGWRVQISMDAEQIVKAEDLWNRAYPALKSSSDTTRSRGSIKLLIRYQRRPLSSGSTALISYMPAAALRLDTLGRRWTG
jgi:hypothetical protein